MLALHRTPHVCTAKFHRDSRTKNKAHTVFHIGTITTTAFSSSFIPILTQNEFIGTTPAVLELGSSGRPQPAQDH